MKKILSFLIVFIAVFMPINVYASDAAVNVEVVGKVEKGSTIEILVNLKDVKKFYAASVDFTYDTSQLKVESIEATEFITKHVNDIMELGGETDKNGNTASYSFTFLGDNNGISGSGTLVKITANLLNNENLSINQENMKIKLVHRVEDSVENYSYKFSGYGVDNKTDGSNDSTNVDNSNSNNNSDDKENVNGNKNENSTSNIVNSDDSISNNDVVNSNISNEVSSDIEEKDNNLNSDGEEVVKEASEKNENQKIDNKNENNEKFLNETTEKDKSKSYNEGGSAIWGIASLGILAIVIVGIKYRTKL